MKTLLQMLANECCRKNHCTNIRLVYNFRNKAFNIFGELHARLCHSLHLYTPLYTSIFTPLFTHVSNASAHLSAISFHTFLHTPLHIIKQVSAYPSTHHSRRLSILYLNNSIHTSMHTSLHLFVRTLDRGAGLLLLLCSARSAQALVYGKHTANGEKADARKADGQLTVRTLG